MVATACSGGEKSDGGANGSDPSATAPTSTAAPSDGSGGGSTNSSTAPGGSETAAGGTATTMTAADFDGSGTCRLTPEQTAGPFPLDEQFDRRDITEGLAGYPLRLGFQVVDERCEPVAGARVEVWHTDPSGDYSAFADGGGGKDEAEGTTFLRGTQATDDDGIAEFVTVYPGWYRGRAVHIHLRVRLDDTVVATSQAYFDEAETERILATGLYAEFGPPDTTWADDGIAGAPAAEGTAFTLRPDGAGSLALLRLSVMATGTTSPPR